MIEWAKAAGVLEPTLVLDIERLMTNQLPNDQKWQPRHWSLGIDSALGIRH
jgi:hypothetical protein